MANEVGEWFKRLLFWVDQHIATDDLFRRIFDPIRSLYKTVVVDSDGSGLLFNLPWYIWLIAAIVFGTLARRTHRGLRAAIALLTIQLIGDEIWSEAKITIASVLLGVALGCVAAVLPAALAAASPAFRRVLRRLVDNLQLLTLTGLSVPMIFIFGIGETSSLLIVAFVTAMVMAKAATGAFLDVRTLPRLAGSEVMAGINTAVLLGVWLHTSNAVMGAGGLGLRQFRGLNNTSASIWFEATIALLLVSIALDQLTRPTRRRGVLLDRTQAAWRLPDRSSSDRPLTPTLLRGAPPTVLGAIVALGGLVLPWSKNRATLTSHVRLSDRDLPGASFAGLHEQGGSAFGYAVATLAIGALVGVLLRALRGNGPVADFTSTVGAAISVVSAAFLITAASPYAVSHGVTAGPIVSLVGGLIIVAGTAIQHSNGGWIDVEESARFGFLTLIPALVLAGALVVAGGMVGWVVNTPINNGLTAEVAAQIEALRAEAEADPSVAPINASLIQQLVSEGRQVDWITNKGFHVDGPHTAFAVAGASALAILLTLVAAAGVERARWLAYGLAVGAAAASGAWILSTIVDNDEGNYTDGGPFLAMVGAASIAAIARRGPSRRQAKTVAAGTSPVVLEELDITQSEPLVESHQALEQTAETEIDGATTEIAGVATEITVPAEPS